jgi:hypothetical protein
MRHHLAWGLARITLATLMSLPALLCSPAWANADAAAEDDATPWDESETETRFSAAMETWAYHNRLVLPGDSVLNPGNRLGRIPEKQWVSDTRLNIKVDRGDFQLVLQPRQVEQWDRPGSETDPSVRDSIRQHHSETSLTQANLKWKHGPHTAVIGREVLSWGPANFRSPSNPFYFDSGRTSPLAATPGLDLARYTCTLGNFRFNIARIHATDQLSPRVDLGQSTLFKIDHQGEAHLASVSLVRRKDVGDHVGAFFQYSPDDAWMFFGEYGTVRPVKAETPPLAVSIVQRVEDILAQQGLFQRPPRSGGTSILGASYTLQSGHTLTGEWMRNQGGLNGRQQQRFFEQLDRIRLVAPLNQALSDALTGATLLRTPPLFGRDYLWMSAQSNTQETKQYWRAEVAHSIQDKSRRLLLYGEKTFQSKVAAFVAVTASEGGPKSEFGAFVKGSVTVGVKLFIF